MGENRRFVRVRPAGLVSRGARIIVDQKKAPTIDCTVIDLSAGGACLEIYGQVQIPKRFVLFHGGTKKSCLVMWRTGRRLGVSF